MKKLLSIIGFGVMLTALAANQNKIPANQKLRMAEAAVAQFYVDTGVP